MSNGCTLRSTERGVDTADDPDVALFHCRTFRTLVLKRLTKAMPGVALAEPEVAPERARDCRPPDESPTFESPLIGRIEFLEVTVAILPGMSPESTRRPQLAGWVEHLHWPSTSPPGRQVGSSSTPDNGRQRTKSGIQLAATHQRWDREGRISKGLRTATAPP